LRQDNKRKAASFSAFLAYLCLSSYFFRPKYHVSLDSFAKQYFCSCFVEGDMCRLGGENVQFAQREERRVCMEESAEYEVILGGCLGKHWMVWFAGMEMRYTEDGHTMLRGWVRDQAALHGMLRTVRDVGLPLLALRRVTEQKAA
jgi:hypothetical protein